MKGSLLDTLRLTKFDKQVYGSKMRDYRTLADWKLKHIGTSHNLFSLTRVLFEAEHLAEYLWSKCICHCFPNVRSHGTDSDETSPFGPGFWLGLKFPPFVWFHDSSDHLRAVQGVRNSDVWEFIAETPFDAEAQMIPTRCSPKDSPGLSWKRDILDSLTTLSICVSVFVCLWIGFVWPFWSHLHFFVCLPIGLGKMDLYSCRKVISFFWTFWRCRKD